MKKIFWIVFTISIISIFVYANWTLKEEEVIKEYLITGPQGTHNISNEDYVGWLTIPNTKVNYPVMHTPKEQNKYLHKDINGKKSSSGTLFMSSMSDKDTDMLIYGHNMSNGTMFKDVSKYANRKFFENHKRILFESEGQYREFEVFAVCKSQVFDNKYKGFKYYDYDYLTTKERYDEYVDNVKRLSIHKTDIRPTFGEHLITLSTCSYHTKNGRIFVVGVERPVTFDITEYQETIVKQKGIKEVILAAKEMVISCFSMIREQIRER